MLRTIWFLPVVTMGYLPAAPSIVVDGRFDDWAQVGPGFTAKEPKPLVRAVSVTADAQRVFIRVTFAGEQNIHALPGRMTLLANSDGDAATGDAGVDVALDFSSGVSVTTFENGKRSPVTTGVHDLGLAAAPSFAAQDVEIGFPRGQNVGSRKNLFSGRAVHWKLVVRDDSTRIVQQGEFTSTLPAISRRRSDEAQTDPLRKPREADFRVVVWNIHKRSWYENPEPYRRILRSLQPDIVLLDEVFSEIPEAWIRSFLKSLRPDGKEWNLLIAKTGGWERSMVATPFPLTPAFNEVRHTSETLKRLGPLLEPSLPKEASQRKGLEDGITASSAFVTIGSRKLLATAIDLVCCGNDKDSLPERRREAEVDGILKRLRETIRSRPVDGVITGGDFNLVSSRRPMDVLRENLDPAGGHLAADFTPRLDGWGIWTWTSVAGEATSFMRGKLDYLLYSPSRLELRRSFVFDAADLPPQWRLHHKIQADDTAARDHRPVVADFRWK